MKTIQDRIVEEAYTWIGTPYYMGCVKGINGGVSCADMPVDVCKTLGLIPKTYRLPNFYKDWQRGIVDEITKNVFRDIILKFGYEIPILERERGDFVTFIYGGVESHIGIVVEDDCIIHAVTNRGVKKQRIGKYKNICSAYRINNV